MINFLLEVEKYLYATSMVIPCSRSALRPSVIRDKSISTSPDTSATMVDLSQYNNTTDLFDIGKFIKNTTEDISNATKIEYEPKPTECEPNDPFNNWVRE